MKKSALLLCTLALIASGCDSSNSAQPPSGEAGQGSGSGTGASSELINSLIQLQSATPQDVALTIAEAMADTSLGQDQIADALDAQLQIHCSPICTIQKK